MEQYDIRVHEDITVHDPAKEGLSLVVIVLLVLFFPIGIIFFIARNISRISTERTDRQHTKATTESIKTDTSILQSQEIASYYDLYQKGILSKAEFEAKKDSILLKKKLTAKSIRR